MMYDFESSYNKLREIAGLNFVSFQMLDNLALSDEDLRDFLRELEMMGYLSNPQHSQDREGRKYPSVFRLKA